MTNLELQQAHAHIRMCGAIVNHCENIDWEQRLYEVSKEIYPMMCADHRISTYQTAAEKTVDVALLLIEELKKRI